MKEAHSRQFEVQKIELVEWDSGIGWTQRIVNLTVRAYYTNSDVMPEVGDSVSVQVAKPDARESQASGLNG